MYKSVIPRHKAENVVLEYVPRKMHSDISSFAEDYAIRRNAEGSDFQMSDVIRIQTGVAGLEQKTVKEQAEALALEKLKEIEERAYKEAFELGLLEGKKEAFNKHESFLTDQMAQFTQLMEAIANMKNELVSFNETHVVKLISYMASRIAMEEIKADPEKILSVIHHAVEVAQEEEDMTLKISESDYQFLQTLSEELKQKHNYLSKIKLESTPGITTGGCILETNYGVIDATIEERLNRILKFVEENAPKVEDKVESP